MLLKLFCFQTFQWIALGCQKCMEAYRNERYDTHNQQRNNEYSDMSFCSLDELLQPMLHQPPRYRHGNEIGNSYLDEERTVQQPDDADSRCPMHLSDSYLTDALADGIPGDAEQAETSKQQGDKRIGVQYVGELHHFLVALHK